MTNVLLFTGVALIWGTTWLAAKLQTGVVPVEIALIYRMGGAGFLLFTWLSLRGQLHRAAVLIPDGIGTTQRPAASTPNQTKEMK